MSGTDWLLFIVGALGMMVLAYFLTMALEEPGRFRRWLSRFRGPRG